MTAVAATAAACIILAPAAPAFAAATGFTTGDLVVYQTAEAAGATPSSTAGSVSLVDYSPAGVPSGYSVALPIADNGSTHALVESGTATNDGDLTSSADGAYLYVTGYDAAPGTLKVTSETPAPARTVGIVSATGAVDTSTAYTDATTEGQNFRSATGATGGSGTIYNGGGAGIGTSADGATTNNFVDTTDNAHQVQISGGNLYASTTSNIVELAGLPSGSETSTALIAAPPAKFSANGFAFATLGSGTAPNTLYVADTGANAVEKYAYNGSSATLEGSVGIDDPTGLVVTVAGGVASVYVTNGVGTNTYATQLSELTDTSGAGGTLTGTFTKLATAASNASFHGLALAPTAAPGTNLPEVPLAVVLPIVGVGVVGGFGALKRRRARA